MKRTVNFYFFVCLTLCSCIQNLHAQDSIPKAYIDERIKILEDLKTTVEREEKDGLRNDIENINLQLDRNKITQEEAVAKKKEAAELRAANIKNRQAILDNRIELFRRNKRNYSVQEYEELRGSVIKIGEVVTIGTKQINNKPRKYDRRTTTDFVAAIGFNNSLIEGVGLGDSPYKKGGSGFVELGVAQTVRILPESNFARFRYGLSFQWNKLNPKDDLYFEEDGDLTELVEFPMSLTKSEFRVTNLVVPIHFEFGPSKRYDRKTYFRYSTHDQFKIGIGGYGGVRLGTQQKLKFKEDGDRVKQKIRKNYNTSNFVYGLSAYVGIDDISLYLKYDLSPLFKDQVVEQNNISMGVRFDLD